MQKGMFLLQRGMFLRRYGNPAQQRRTRLFPEKTLRPTCQTYRPRQRSHILSAKACPDGAVMNRVSYSWLQHPPTHPISK